MKKILMLLTLVFTVVACTATNSGIAETNEKQIARLLKEADKREQEAAKMNVETKVEVVNEEAITTEEMVEVVEEIDPRKSHKGMTRGEIMQYEMERVKTEMEELQSSVNTYAERVKALKEHKAKLEKLENLNRASMK